MMSDVILVVLYGLAGTVREKKMSCRVLVVRLQSGFNAVITPLHQWERDGIFIT